MFNRRRFLATSMAAAIAFVSMVSLTAQPSMAKNGGRQPRLEGTLVSVNLATSTVSVRRQNGVVVSLFIPANAKIERNDLHATLGAFKVGDKVQARFAADGTTVIKFEGVGP